MLSPNPFTPMLLTYNPRRFFGREKEIASILHVITASEPGGHAIYGIRTIGKTTLLKFLKDRNGAIKRYESYVGVDFRPGGEKSLLFIYLNFHIFTEGESIFYMMLEQLDDELQETNLAENITIPAYEDESPKQEIVNILRRTLQRLNMHHVRVVFLLDDFDLPLSVIEPHDDGLLRTLCDFAALIIATEAPISELRPDIGASSPLLGILRPESLGLITEQAAKQLVIEPSLDTPTQFNDLEADFLITTAGRQPFLLTAACEMYFDLHNEYADITQLIEQQSNFPAQFIYRLSGQLHVMSVLQNTWNKLHQPEQRTLYNIATGSTIGLEGEIGSLANRLTNKGLIYFDFKQNVYRIFGLLFGEFVSRNYAFGEEKTLIDSPKPTLESLTPIDGALLRYLVNHADRTCTFEELLDAIWSDGEKSKRALEAAVFRIRKTLEPDEHIKNIRGKGYRFVKTNFAEREAT